MMRSTALLASGLLTASLTLVGTPAAHAATTCTGTGQATLETGIRYFPELTPDVDFEFFFNCLEGATFSGFGTLWTASCGQSFGIGTVPGIGTVGVQTAGSMVIISPVIVDPRTTPPTVTTGENVVGGGNATPIPNTSTIPFGNSCANGTATVFQLTGGAVFDV